MSGTTTPAWALSQMFGPAALPQQSAKPLFADAPVQQQPQLGQIPSGASPLAQALMRAGGMPQLATPNIMGQLPLASMMANRDPNQPVASWLGSVPGIGNALGYMGGSVGAPAIGSESMTPYWQGMLSGVGGASS